MRALPQVLEHVMRPEAVDPGYLTNASLACVATWAHENRLKQWECDKWAQQSAVRSRACENRGRNRGGQKWALLMEHPFLSPQQASQVSQYPVCVPPASFSSFSGPHLYPPRHVSQVSQY